MNADDAFKYMQKRCEGMENFIFDKDYPPRVHRGAKTVYFSIEVSSRNVKEEQILDSVSDAITWLTEDDIFSMTGNGTSKTSAIKYTPDSKKHEFTGVVNKVIR